MHSNSQNVNFKYFNFDANLLNGLRYHQIILTEPKQCFLKIIYVFILPVAKTKQHKLGL